MNVRAVVDEVICNRRMAVSLQCTHQSVASILVGNLQCLVEIRRRTARQNCLSYLLKCYVRERRLAVRILRV